MTNYTKKRERQSGRQRGFISKRPTDAPKYRFEEFEALVNAGVLPGAVFFQEMSKEEFSALYS